MNRIDRLIARLKVMKGTAHWGHKKIHPWIWLEDRDLIVRALENLKITEFGVVPEPYLRRNFRFVAQDGHYGQLCTGISVTVPAGLTRQHAIDFVAGRVAGEVARYAASEALGFGPHDQNTDWSEIVT